METFYWIVLNWEGVLVHRTDSFDEAEKAATETNGSVYKYYITRRKS